MSTIVEIIFKNVDSPANKELTDYLGRNMEAAIMRGNVRFKFRIVKPKEAKELVDKGYKKFPAMNVYKQKQLYLGVKEIVNQLISMIKNSGTIAKPKTEDELLNDYFRAQLGDVKQDGDGKFILPSGGNDADAENIDLGELTAREVQRRGQLGHGATGSYMDEPEKEERGAGYYDVDKTLKSKPKTGKGNGTTPSKPARNTVRDDSDDESSDEDAAPKHHRPRKNNIAATSPPSKQPKFDDTQIALRNIKAQGGEGTKDDAMMAQLLEKMNGYDV